MGTKTFSQVYMKSNGHFIVYTCVHAQQKHGLRVQVEKRYPSEKKLRDTTHMDEKSEKN